MKKAIKALFAFLFVILTVFGALSAENKNKPEIKTVDNYIAVFDFEVRTGDKGISGLLADKVIHEFSMSDKYEVIDRGNMNKILKEQKFQLSGCVAQECKVEAGQILGVGKIVSGSVGIIGKTYYLTLQLIDVKTGKVELSAEDECRCEIDELLGSIRRLVKKLLGERIEQPAEAIARAKAEEERIKTEKETRAKAEEEKIKAQIAARAKVEEERIKVEIAARAKAEEERIKAEKADRAKAEEIAKAKTEADELARQKSALELEKQEMERQKALAAEREQLAKERRKIEAERQQLAIAKRTSQPTTGENARDGRFIAYSNGTVLDTKTNLMWAAKDNGSNISWTSAKNYCENYRGGGYTDWRMPTLNELASLYDDAKTYKSGCGGNVHLTELISLTCTWVLALETSNSNAGNFSFNVGHEYWAGLLNEPFRRALPVRSAK